MISVVLLDTGPLGLITNPKASPEGIACQNWLQSLTSQRIRAMIPEVADYEVRRELVRAGKTTRLANLNGLALRLPYLPVTTQAWRQAALFWAQARQQGQPTAGSNTLDADVILAAQAVTLGLPAGQVVIATTNVGHLARFTYAKRWQDIP